MGRLSRTRIVVKKEGRKSLFTLAFAQGISAGTVHGRVLALDRGIITASFDDAVHQEAESSLSNHGAIELAGEGADVVGGGAGVQTVHDFRTGFVTVCACLELNVTGFPGRLHAVTVAVGAVKITIEIEAIEEDGPCRLTFH